MIMIYPQQNRVKLYFYKNFRVYEPIVKIVYKLSKISKLYIQRIYNLYYICINKEGEKKR